MYFLKHYHVFELHIFLFLQFEIQWGQEGIYHLWLPSDATFMAKWLTLSEPYQKLILWKVFPNLLQS